mmetsp:Transcript_175220/g.561963  ORF Transcript_175220/g.561963 Transcript_175220/m.561963 type:complete len:284 (+) Transcript_175220:858-1709(+)
MRFARPSSSCLLHPSLNSLRTSILSLRVCSCSVFHFSTSSSTSCLHFFQISRVSSFTCSCAACCALRCSMLSNLRCLSRVRLARSFCMCSTWSSSTMTAHSLAPSRAVNGPLDPQGCPTSLFTYLAAFSVQGVEVVLLVSSLLRHRAAEEACAPPPRASPKFASTEAAHAFGSNCARPRPRAELAATEDPSPWPRGDEKAYGSLFLCIGEVKGAPPILFGTGCRGEDMTRLHTRVGQKSGRLLLKQLPAQPSQLKEGLECQFSARAYCTSKPADHATTAMHIE